MGKPVEASEVDSSSQARRVWASRLQRVSAGGLVALALLFSTSHYSHLFDVAPGVLQPEFGSVLVYFSDLFLVGAVGCWSVAHLLTPGQSVRVAPRSVTVALAVWAGWGTLSLLWTRSAPLTAAQAMRWWWLWGLYLMARQVSYRVRRWLERGWIAAGLVQSGVALGQFFLQRQVGLHWAGEMVRDAHVPGAIVVQVGQELWLRPAALCSSPNALGAFLVVSLLLLLGRALTPQRLSRKRAVCLGASVVFLTVAMLSTFTRASWLGLIAGLGVIGYAVWRSSSRHTRTVALTMTVALITTTVIFVAVYWPLFYVRLAGTAALLSPRTAPNMTERANMAQRTHYRSTALDLWMSSPWLGVGLGSSPLMALLRDPPTPGELGHAPVHSVPLLLLVELGPVGLGGWLAVASCVAWKVWRQRAFLSSSLSWAAWSGAMVALLLMSCFDHHYLTYQQGRVALWLTLGLWAAGTD